MTRLNYISRFLLAPIFIFSSFGKGVDPLGTAYKVEDYFIAYNMDWALPLSLIIAIGLIALEFSLGIMLIFNLLPKFSRWAMLVLMVFFTLVTFFDAIYNPIPDCGCFGDALILTNWQTFYKNIIIDFLLIGLFLYKPRKINLRKNLVWSLVIFTAFLSFSFYNLKHLPIIDFRSWKVGTQVFNTEQKAIQLYLSYQNKNTGEIKEFLSPNFPYQDSLWLSNWEYKSTRELNPNTDSESIMFFDREGNEATNEVLGISGINLLIIAYDLDAITKEKAKKIRTVIQIANEENFPIAIITSSVGTKIANFINNHLIDIPIFLADDIDLKTMIRSNPGLIFLENGKVIKKWAYADFPTDINQIYE
ncbi:MAG: DoxX family protein [Bacteroidales bacterium]|nr:DoxX family protein [Bacteroidales bacterium]